MKLPEYAPPSALSAFVAVAVAPLLVLLAFALVVVQTVDSDTGLAALTACTLWILAEMHGYQRHLDAYNADFVQTHLSWRSAATLQVLAMRDDCGPETRAFVMAYLQAERALRPETPKLQ